MPHYASRNIRPILGMLTLALAFSTLAPSTQAGRRKFSAMRLRIAGKMVSDTVPVRASGNEIYVGTGVLKFVGAKGKMDKRGDSLRVTPADSDRSQEVALAQIEGKTMLPLSELARVIGGVVVRAKSENETNSETNLEPLTHLLAQVRHVQVKSGVVRVETTFPVLYRVRNVSEEAPARGYIDCIGATVAEDLSTKIAPDMERSVQKIRTGQNEPDVARVVVEFQQKQSLRITDSLDKPSDIIYASLTPRDAQETEKPTIQKPVRIGEVAQGAPPRGGRNTGIKSNRVGRGGTRGGRTDTPDLSATPALVQNILPTLEPDNVVRLEIVMQGQVQPLIRYNRSRSQMYIDLPNAMLSLSPSAQATHDLNYPMMTRLFGYMLEGKIPTTRIAIDVNQNLRYRYRWLDNILRIDLKVPDSTSGILAGRTIVIDPGHGGSSLGAAGREDGSIVYEKNITLSISLKLRSALQAMGAEVIMTRESDVAVDLYERPKLANSIGADLFISIHNDSTKRSNQASGTTTYYHMNNPKARSLAKMVQKAVAAVTGLPSRGAVSDGALYQSGLAVLRASNMPAILVEVAYINTDGDRKRLIDPEFQQNVADAIAAGVGGYASGIEVDDSTEKEPNRTRSTPLEPTEREDEIESR